MATSSGKSKLFAQLTFDHKRLAALAEDAGENEKAAKHYASAGTFRDAARLYAAAGMTEPAVRCAFQAVLGKKVEKDAKAGPLQAAELLVSASYHREASALFELAGSFHEAAKSALRSGQTARAGFLYDRAKQWTKAATAYEKAGKLEDAARVLDLEARRLRGEIGGAPAEATASRRHQVERKRAELLARIGRGSEAAKVMRDAAATGASGETLERSGRNEEAIEAYVESQFFDEALRLARSKVGTEPRKVPDILRRAGRLGEAAKMYAAHGFAEDAAECYEQVEDWMAAGRQWSTARQPQRAAQAYERAGQFAEAASCFAAVGEHARAAEVFVRAGDDAHAAASWAKAGRDEEAATAFVRSRQFFSAAQHFLSAGRKLEARQALQQIPKNDPTFERGNIKLAAMLFEDGAVEDAFHRLRLLSADLSPDNELGRDRLYWEGRCLEALHRPAEAKVRYEQLLAACEDHRDAAARLRDLLVMLQASTVSLATSAGATSVMAGNPAAGHTVPASIATGPTQVVAPGQQAPIQQAPMQQVPTAGGLQQQDSTMLDLGSVLANRYQILDEIGHGGMGRVYKATDSMLGDDIALKTLLAPQEGSQDEARLLREVQICRKITHPNVVRVHDVGRYAGGLFVTMELLEGKSLHAVLHRQGRLNLKQTRTVLSQVAMGLSEAHELGVVHRDLKPGNVFVTDRHVKVLDFGIARMESQETRLTRTGSAVGSPHYMSPEQLRGLEVDGRSDLYALGVMAFTLIVGREPFQGETIAAVAVAHLQQPVPDLRTLVAGIPAAWASLVSRLLAKNASGRPASAAAVVEELSRLPTQPVAATASRTEAVGPA